MAESSVELPLSFSSFVVSLASSAMYHLGEVPDPETGKRVVDLPRARETIDLLGVFQEKTKGNLDEGETKLLEALLYDTRTRYVAKVKEAGGEAPETE